MGFPLETAKSPALLASPPFLGPPGTPEIPGDPRDPAGTSRRDLPRDPPFCGPSGTPFLGPPGTPFLAPPGPPPGGGVFGPHFWGPPPPPPPPRCARRVCAGARTVQKGDFGGVKKGVKNGHFLGKIENEFSDRIFKVSKKALGSHLAGKLVEIGYCPSTTW